MINDNKDNIIKNLIEKDSKQQIIENNQTIFEVRTFAGSNEQAKLISENWKNNAYTIYPKLLSLLTGKE